MRSILVTRPEPAASEFAEKLRREGFRVFLAPLSDYVPQDTDLSALTACQAVVFTSAQAVTLFAARNDMRHLTAFAVGDTTADAARAAGFTDVPSAAGDSRDLAALLLKNKSERGLEKILHVCGEDTAEDLSQLLAGSGIDVIRAVIYKAVFRDAFPPDIDRALIEGEVTTVTLFSARAAEKLVQLLSRADLRDVSGGLEAVCLSDRVAAELRGTPWRALQVAKAPRLDAVMDILRAAEPTNPLPAALPADPVIDAFGGLRPLANSLNITASTVQGWKKRGMIPDTRVAAILAAAAEQGIDPRRFYKEGQNNMTMDDAGGKPQSQSGGGDRRRSTDRRQHRPTVDDRGHVHAKSYHGPDRRTGLDRRAYHELQQKRIRDEKMKFVNRTVIMAVFFFIAIIYGAGFLMAPEFFRLKENAERVHEFDDLIKKHEEEIRRLQKQRYGEAVPTPQPSSPVPLGSRLNQSIQSVENAVSDVKATLGSVAGDVQQVASQNDTYRSLQELFKMLSMLQKMNSTPDGAQQVDGMMGRLMGVMDNAGSDAESLSAAVEGAKQTDPTLNAVLGNIDKKDLGAAAVLLTLNELRGNMGGQKSFDSDLKIIQKYAGDDPELQTALKRLAPYAKSGVLSRDTLQKEFRSIAADIVMAKLQGEDATVRDRVLQRLNKYVKTRKIDDIEGQSVDAVVARAELLLDQGDVQGAIRELQSLDGAPADTAAPWLQQAQGHVLADESSQAMLQMVMDQLGAGGENFSLEGIFSDVMQQLNGGGATVPYLSPSLQQGSSGGGSVYPLP